jgi:RimJ/RimL family protein N-acetyltransferase
VPGRARGPELRTERLLLRRWRASDREPFARLNGDPVVMEFFTGPQSPEVSAQMIEAFEHEFDAEGYGLWAVEVPGELPLAGFVGLMRVGADLPFAPAVEVGWRLTPQAWGRSIAFEAATAALRFGFERAGVEQVVSYTAAANVRSRRLMERLGMRRDPAEDFEHPRIARGHPLAVHVVYRLERPAGRSDGGA